MPNYTWTGADGADWNVAADWSPAGGPPGVADIGLIAAGRTASVGSAAAILGLTIGAGAALQIGAGVGFRLDGAINNGGVIFDAGTLVAGQATVDLFGAGVFGLAVAGDAARISALTPGNVLVNFGQTITGTGTIGGGLALQNMAAGVIDAATLTANSATLTVDGGSFTILNAGLIEATTGVLVLRGRVSNSGTIAAAGDTVMLSGSVAGGTLASSGTGEILVVGGASATLDGSGVAIANTGMLEVAVQGGLTLLGSVVNSGTITLDEYTPQYFGLPAGTLGAAVTLASPTVTLSGGGTLWAPYLFYDPRSLAPDITPATISGSGMLVNVNDTIEGGYLTINVPMTNEAAGVLRGGGVARAFYGSGNYLAGYSIVSSGLTLTNNVVNDGLMIAPFFEGVVDQSGGGIIRGGDIVAGSGSLVRSALLGRGGVIEGGTLEGSIYAPYMPSTPGVFPTLDGSTWAITNLGTFAVDTQMVDLLLGTIHNAGAMSLGVASTTEVASPSCTLDGGGQVRMVSLASNATTNITAAAFGNVLVNMDNSISGVGDIGAGMLVLDNRAGGSIAAQSGTLTLDPAGFSNLGTLAARSGTLMITVGTYASLGATWIAQSGTIALPAAAGIPSISGSVTLDGAGAEIVSSSGSNIPVLTNSYLAPQTIQAGGTLAVLNGAMFGMVRTPGTTIVAGGSTLVAGNVLQPFGNAGLVQLGGGTVSLQAAVRNSGRMVGFGSLIASDATVNNADGTMEAQGGLLRFQGVLSGGTLAVDAGATLDLAAGWYGGGGAVPAGFAPGGGVLQIEVVNTAGSFSQAGSLAVAGFVLGDTIEIAGTLAGGGAFPGFSISDSGTALTILGGGRTLGVLGFAGGTSNVVVSTDASNNAIITAACFAEGTRIRTAEGEMRIEALRVGDLVVSAFGGVVPVMWLGWRRVEARRYRDGSAIWPVRVQAGALAEGVPGRDLWLSPEHAVFLDGVLVPVRCLINGGSIAQMPVGVVTYWHVELPQHDVVLAEGMACESYLDTGNRADFDNGGGVIVARPMFGATADEIWRACACAPQCREGARLAAIRGRIAASRPLPSPPPEEGSTPVNGIKGPAALCRRSLA